MILLIIIIGFIIFILFFSFHETKKGEEEMRRFSDSRPYLSKTKYINILVSKGYEKQQIEIVYDTIKEFITWDFFCIYPEGDIYKIYGLDDLDDIELFDVICGKLNLRKVEQKDCDLISDQFETVNAEYILALTKIIAQESEK